MGAKIILFGGEKGGSGKSTGACNAAAGLAHRNHNVLLIDSDRQGTASKWADRRVKQNDLARLTCVQKFGDVFDTVKDFHSKFDYIVIDAGGRDSEELRTAMLASDILYLPMKASRADVETLPNMKKMVNDARKVNKQLQARLLIAMASTNPSTKETAETRQFFEKFADFTISKTQTYERKAYRDALDAGKSVIESKDIKASREIEMLVDEITEE